MARDRASRPEAKPLRLFIAVDIPEHVRTALARTIEPVKQTVGRARWVPPQNWHVTLKFLGAVWPRLVEWVEEACGSVAAAHAPFGLSVEGLGAFPNARRARVLWAGLEDRKGAMSAIATELDRALEREFRPEKRPFAAHLTVARFDPPRELPQPLTGAGGAETFPVDRIVLYRSHLRRPAPVYEALRSFELGGP